jgi:preprotein translocase subunit SecA
MLKNPFTKNSISNEYKTLVTEINELEKTLTSLTDGELRKKSIQLQKQYKQNQNLLELTREAFALTREASLRTLGLRHFDV